MPAAVLAVAAVASVAAAAIGADSARSAANTQADAAANAAKAQKEAAGKATDTQLQMFEEGRADTAPWREAGARALTTLEEKVNAGPGEFTTSPGYQFRLEEGENAINRSAAARGGVLSGATLKALNRFNQDYASNEYQNFLANYYQSLTPYQSLADKGMTATMAGAQQGNQVGANIGQNQIYAGNALAQGYIGAGNAQAGGAINNANVWNGAINSGINNYLMWKYMNTNSGAGATT